MHNSRFALLVAEYSKCCNFCSPILRSNSFIDNGCVELNYMDLPKAVSSFIKQWSVYSKNSYVCCSPFLAKKLWFLFFTSMNNSIDKSYALLIVSIKCTSKVQPHSSALTMS